jgi:protease-4
MDIKKTPRLLLYPVQKSWLESLLQGNSATFSERVAVAIKKELVHELVPQRNFSSMAAFYEMLKNSGQLQMLAVMPCEIVIQ